MGLVDYIGRSPSRQKLLAGEVPAWVAASSRGTYIAQVLLSAPPWVDKAELRLLQAWARAMTKFSGHLHVLDHIVPMTHERVCGLTTPWNLQVIHWRANSSKGNKWCPEQQELFE